MRVGATWLAAISLSVGLAAPAHAQHLLTWKTTSRYVDPSQVRFNAPPPGVAPRRPALRVNILLPRGYDRSRRYPVLFLLHGHGDSFDSWVNPAKGDLRDIARGFPGIIVMPEAARGWYTNWWNGGRRGSPSWERYHLDELVPLVERRLRIRPGRRWHAIAGLSMGGEGALFYASQRPGYFGSAASFSGVLSLQRPEWPEAFDTQGERHQDVFGDPQAQRFYWTGHNPTALVDNLHHTRLFVTVGDGVPNPASRDEVTNTTGQLAEAELRQHAQDFVRAAQDAGADVTYQPRQGIHDWPYWRQHLQAAIRWGFFQAVDEQPRSWRFSTVSRSGDMWGVRFRFARAPGTVETFVREGKRLSATGRGKVVLRSAGGHRLTLRLPFDQSMPAGFFGS